MKKNIWPFFLFIFCSVIALAQLPASAAPLQSEVFVGGQDGYHTYRIPSLLVTKKGTLLAFCEGRKNSKSDTGDIDLLLKRSTDNGKTWSPQQIVWDDGANTCGNPCPVVDAKTGIIWLLLTHNLGADKESAIKAGTAAGTRTVWITKSKDDGKTWSPPLEITRDVKDPSWDWYATGPGVGLQIQDGPHRGRLVIPCNYIEGGAEEGRGAHVIYSDDHGQSWQRSAVIRPHMNESQVVELADDNGSLQMNMRSYFGRSRRAFAQSQDGGQTWTAPQDYAELIEPICQGSIVRYTWPDRREKSRILFSNPADEKVRQNMTVRLSYDEGKTWPVAKTLNAGPSAYSCLSILRDRSMACLYERGEKNSTEKITFARFDLEWLTDGKDALAGGFGWKRKTPR